MLGFGSSGGDRGGAETGFIGEDAAGDTVLHGHHDGGACKTTGSSRACEGTLENQGNGSRDGIEMHEDKAKADGDVHDGHKRDDLGGDFGDALQAAEGDSGNQQCQDDVRSEFRHTKGDIDTVDDGVDLREGTDAEISDEDRCDGEEGSERFILFAHAVADVEHRAAGNLAFFIGAAILDGEQAFGVFRCHAEECGHPHPEDGTRAADLHSRGDADDVARADRSGEGDAECLEARDITFAVVLGFEDKAERFRQAEYLQQVQADRQEDARADQKRDQRRPPHEGVDGIEYRDE